MRKNWGLARQMIVRNLKRRALQKSRTDVCSRSRTITSIEPPRGALQSDGPGTPSMRWVRGEKLDWIGFVPFELFFAYSLAGIRWKGEARRGKKSQLPFWREREDRSSPHDPMIRGGSNITTHYSVHHSSSSPDADLLSICFAAFISFTVYTAPFLRPSLIPDPNLFSSFRLPHSSQCANSMLIPIPSAVYPTIPPTYAAVSLTT
ncbi:hypothetical protein AXG93_3348s1030 [Marchantia polymorpha subsp. ruderalis]|uniref:Uncharacterized protein n=1 Tax=Marchantia polymorpha subsp. ruderalis TaxID=1480154 RepID=A0A176VRF4_MARPO|nr:hypothetical protein AXG93_3348s1030 [Marchantia polymorpha subsp. ruderalis]